MSPSVWIGHKTWLCSVIFSCMNWFFKQVSSCPVRARGNCSMPGNLWSSTSLSCLSLSLSPQFLHSHFRCPLGSRGFLFWRHSCQFPIGSYSQSHGSLFYTQTQSRFSATTKVQKNSPGRRHGLSWLSLPPSKGWMTPISCRPLPHFLGSHKIRSRVCRPVTFMDNLSISGTVRLLK